MADKLIKLSDDRTKLVDGIINDITDTLAENQRQLLHVVITRFLDQLDIVDGVVQNTLKNKRLLSLLDQTLKDFNSNYGTDVVKQVVEGVQKIVSFNSDYFDSFNEPANLIPVKSEVKVLVNQWLGVDKSGTVTPNGYLDTLLKDASVKTDVTDIAVKSMVNQAGYMETKKALSDYIVGTDKDTGALEKYHRNFVFDLFSQVDRASAQVYADKLELNFAIYEGGIIKTTRPFCKARNGKVFTREEISQFNPPTAKPPGYNPFTDLGGYGCRHHLNWIPYALAITLRPDLKEAA